MIGLDWIQGRNFFFHNEIGETVEQVMQRSCGWPISGSVQGQLEQGFEQPDLAKVVAARSKGVVLDDL